ncbi:MAG: T9SS type A sorting domain-containing protein [Ignavibacteria bacterium]
MKALFLALFCLFTTTFTTFAQLDTNNRGPIVYGTLVETKPGIITIKETLPDGTSADREVAYNSDTEIAGCSIDSVQRGVFTLAMLNNLDVFPPLAQLIKFDGCIAHVDVMSVILAKTNTNIETKSLIESLFGPVGTAITFNYDVQTQIYSCDGKPLSMSDISIGDTFYIRAAGNGQVPYATTIQATNDCIQTSQFEGTLLAFVDSTLFVRPDNTTDTVRISINPEFLWNWVPGDSSLPFPFYGCDGQQIPPSALKSGMKISVSYIISPRRGNFLQYAYLKDNCPTHVSGIINEIDGDTISIGIYGQTTRVVLTEETELTNCRREIITKDKLKEGLGVDGLAIEKNGVNIALKLTIIDDCPYSFQADGKIEFINDTAVKIVTKDPVSGGNYAEMELAIDSATVAVDCMNLPINLSAVIAGSYVNILYRMSGPKRIADMIIVNDPCNTNYISGVIESVKGNTIIVKTDRGDMRSADFNDASSIVNCRGEVFTPTSAVIGARFDGMTTEVGNGGFILNATIYTNCVEYDYVSGTISKASDTLITVMTSGGSKDVYFFEDGSMIVNEAGQLIDISELTFGRKVCLVVDKTSSVLLKGIVDINCENGVRDNSEGLMVLGTIQDVSNNELKVVTNNGVMQFVLTKATQMMDESRNSVQPALMSPGSEVRIMTKGHNTELKPIASTVVLMSALSINEQEIPTTQLMVYPNPASSIVTFGAMDYDAITITTMLGQTIAQLNNTHTYDASSLTPGTYIVRATKAGKTSVTMMQISR